MLPSRATLPSTALALVLAAQAAHADLTPSDVWEDWRTYISGFGNSIEATETTSGDSLIISDLSVNMNLPEDQGKGVMQIGTLTFTSNGDGTVDISMAETMPIVMQMEADTGEALSYQLDFVNSGYKMTASGTLAELEYAYTADSLGLVLKELVVNGKTIPADEARFIANLLNVAGNTQMSTADLRSYDQTITADRVEFDLAMKSTEDNGTVAFKGASSEVRFAGTGANPLDAAQSSDFSKLLDAGFSVDGTFTFGAGQSQFNSNGPNDAVNATTTSSGGSVGVDMSGDGVTYNVKQSNLSVDMQTDAAPFPLSFSMQESQFNLTVPLKKSDEAQDFGLGVTLGGFSMSDALWGIFDPTSQLPRDPATVALDLSGKGRLLFDFLDPAAADVSGDPNITPAEVESLDINKLQVSVAGAELTGTGAFTFQNAPTGGMPQPNGAVDLKLVGGNALIDKLVAIGLVPEDQAMGARMMMGLFSVPGSEPDTLTSKIEVNEQGHIIANGQRIQ